MDNNNIYTPKFNNIFIKLMKKICNGNTPLNTTFNWFNKYKVTLQSGTNDFVAVYVEPIDFALSWNFRSYCVASFTIDFLTKKLIIEDTQGNNDIDYFTIADSLIKAFKDIYSDTQTTINDYSLWEETYEEYMEALNNKEEYVDEYIEECNNFINLCNIRNTWIKKSF